jgi:hypothetical protein
MTEQPTTTDLVLATAEQAFGLTEMLDALYDYVGELQREGIPDGGLENVARTFLGIRWLIDQLKGVQADLDAIVAEGTREMPGSMLAVDGWGVLQGKWSPATLSHSPDDKAEMARRVAEWARDHRTVDRHGVVEAPEEAVQRCLLEAFSLTPRKTALRTMGVDVDEYGERRGTGRWSCRVTDNG